MEQRTTEGMWNRIADREYRQQRLQELSFKYGKGQLTQEEFSEMMEMKEYALAELEMAGEPTRIVDPINNNWQAKTLEEGVRYADPNLVYSDPKDAQYVDANGILLDGAPYKEEGGTLHDRIGEQTLQYYK